MMEADGEWSDGSDDALKSGSATGISDGDGDVGTDEKKVLATNRLLKTDPVNAILDRIDAELGAMNIVSPSQSKSSKSSPVKKTSLDTNQIVVKQDIVPPTSTHKTNLQQTTPLNNGAVINGKDKPTKNRSLDQVKEGEQYHSDLDSLAAEQIDEKFKEIMKKKRGGYLDDLNTPVSDAEKIKTDDFKSTIVHSKDSLIPNTSTSFSPSKLTSSLPKQNGYCSDLESIQTEDFESKFAELLVKDGSCSESMDGKTTTFDFKEKSLSESLPKSSLKTISFEGTNNITPQKSSLKSKVESIPPRTMLSIYGRNPPTGTPTGIPTGSNLKNSEKSPVKSSGEKTKSVMFETDSVDETCREIERESARIQLEMGKERRANSPTRITNKPEYSSPSPVRTSTMPPSELLSVAEDDDEKQAIEREVKLLREALHCSRLELRECQTNLKETREKAENAR
ncbi:uncharacterized protein LOC126824170 [Patella vulgata]|uniref:uncharacterized protein LOC126824170 n=1 Tax=Patella vulgata TaxID=6465 RepID=UPI0024A8CBF2|nr:uncharacterized protein LOC126824170 [Patella vulgata]